MVETRNKLAKKETTGKIEKKPEKPLLRINLKFGPLESTIDLLPETKRSAQKNCAPEIEKSIFHGIIKSDENNFREYVENLPVDKQIELLEKMAGTALGIEEMSVGLGKDKNESDLDFLGNVRNSAKKMSFTDKLMIAGFIVTSIMSLYMYLRLKWKVEKIEEKLDRFI